jgi:asparagine synthase (glutamine-hydrolysing)
VLSAHALGQVRCFDPFQRYLEHHDRFRDLDPVQRMLYTDCAVILPDVYFEKVDRATMAFGIEARVPMLDNDLAAYAMSLPSSYKVRGPTTKYILRKALADILPAGVLCGGKLGFNVPFQSWLRTSLAPYLKSVLLDGGLGASGIFNRTELERRVREHVSGSRDYGYLLWKLLNFALWHRRYIAGGGMRHRHVQEQHAEHPRSA